MTVGENSVQYRQRKKKKKKKKKKNTNQPTNQPTNQTNKQTNCLLVAAILFFIGKIIIITKWPPWVVWKFLFLM